MYNHAPPNYTCFFCQLVRGAESPDSLLRLSDIVAQTGDATAFIAARKWPKNPGHVLVIPNRHYENIYDLPATLAAKVHYLAKAIAMAMKAVYNCDGIMLRQHNEPAGGQHIWHYHLHVIPRYDNDDHENTQKEDFPPAERAVYAQKLKGWFDSSETWKDRLRQ